MITERTDLAGFLMTPDAAFGHQRGGTPETLAALGSVAGFEVIVVPAFERHGRQVRSSEIRERIAVGDLDAAAMLLGRPFAVVGEPALEDASPSVAMRTLRFPLPVALPPPGTYRATVSPPMRLDGRPGPDPEAASVEVVESGVRVSAATAAALGPSTHRLRVAFEGD
jgi:FAD synthase